MWSTGTLARHLGVLNQQAGERVTGTAVYRRAARYVAQQLGTDGVQPGLESSFLVPYAPPADSSYVLSVSSSGGAFVTGIDVLRHAETDVGRLEAQSVSIVPRDAVPSSVQPLTLVPSGGRASLRQLRRAGARAVFQVGALRPEAHRTPAVPGLVVGQLTPAAARRLLGVSQEQFEGFMTGDQATMWGLPKRVRVQVRAVEREMPEEALNVVGYVAGRHPDYIDEAVLVCADLDVPGEVGGVPTRDFTSFGIGAAALLETARNIVVAAPAASAMKRSLVVAVWSGSKQGHQGLRAYLQDPMWPMSATSAVYYVGLTQEEEPAVRALLGDTPLHPVRHSGEPLFSPARYLDPSEAQRREAASGPDDLPSPNVDAIASRGAVMARELSETTFQLLLGALSAPGPFAPAAPDTLALPRLLDVPAGE